MISTKSVRYHGLLLARASLLLTLSGYFAVRFDLQDTTVSKDVGGVDGMLNVHGLSEEIQHGAPTSHLAEERTDIQVQEIEKGRLYECSFNLTTGNLTYTRHFQVRLKENAKYLIFDSHGYNTPDYAYQHNFSRFVYNMDYLNASIITTWGSDDSYSKLAGWNAWGWGDKAPPTEIADNSQEDDEGRTGLTQCGDSAFLRNASPSTSEMTTCTTRHIHYECYDTQREGGGCNGTEPEAISATCSTMSAQDDQQYMRTVILFVKQKWGGNAKVVVTGQSMGGIISGMTAQTLGGVVDFSIPVSAAGARNKVQPFSRDGKVKILHLHGIFDLIIPICLPLADVAKIFGSKQLGVEYETKTFELDGDNVTFHRLPRGCNNVYNNSVCASFDYYLYEGLRTTAQMYNYGDSVDGLTDSESFQASFRPTNYTTSLNKEATVVKCARINARAAVCLFNGNHCLPFQKLNSSWECQWQDGDRGTRAFMELVKRWLDSDGKKLPSEPPES